MSKTTLGIDPGKTGAACFLTDDNAYFIDWDDNLNLLWYNFLSFTREHKVDMCVIEKLEDRPLIINGKLVQKKGVGLLNRIQGIWIGFLTAREIPRVELRPRTWQKGIINKSDGSTPKKRALNAACRLYPHLLDELTGPKGGIKDGRVDALLMAYKARELL